MKKQKAILKIESYVGKEGMLVLSAQDLSVRTMLAGLTALCKDKYGGYVMAEVSPPYKKRTTGKDSQNNKIWGMITQIAEYSGHDITDIEDYVKLRAIKRGYPYRTNELTGEIKPYSMSDINTVEASYLIDELYQIAAEMEVPIDDGR